MDYSSFQQEDKSVGGLVKQFVDLLLGEEGPQSLVFVG